MSFEGRGTVSGWLCEMVMGVEWESLSRESCDEWDLIQREAEEMELEFGE